MTDVIKTLEEKRLSVLSTKATGVDGAPSLLSITPADYLGKRWYVVADNTEEEVYQSIYSMGRANALIGLVVLLGLSLAAFFAARRISKPIQAMRDAVGELAAGENVAIPGIGRSDELGELAQSLMQVHASGVAAVQIKSALDCASVNVMVADPEGKIVYCNPAMLAFFRDHAKDFHEQFPAFSAEQMIGATIDQFHRSSGWKDDAITNARVRIASMTIELKVNQIRDAKGNVIGKDHRMA